MATTSTIGFNMQDVKYYLEVDQEDQTKVIATSVSCGTPNYLVNARPVSFSIYEQARAALASEVYDVRYIKQELLLTLNLDPYRQKQKQLIKQLNQDWYVKPFVSNVQGLLIQPHQLPAITMASATGLPITIESTTPVTITAVTAKHIITKYVTAVSSLVDTTYNILTLLDRASTKEQIDLLVSEYREYVDIENIGATV
jgi:hypothetical protein